MKKAARDRSAQAAATVDEPSESSLISRQPTTAASSSTEMVSSTARIAHNPVCATVTESTKSATPSSIISSARSFLVGIDSRVSQLMPVYRNKHADLLRSTAGTGTQQASSMSGQHVSTSHLLPSSSETTRLSRHALGTVPVSKPSEAHHN